MDLQTRPKVLYFVDRSSRYNSC